MSREPFARIFVAAVIAAAFLPTEPAAAQVLPPGPLPGPPVGRPVVPFPVPLLPVPFGILLYSGVVPAASMSVPGGLPASMLGGSGWIPRVVEQSWTPPGADQGINNAPGAGVSTSDLGRRGIYDFTGIWIGAADAASGYGSARGASSSAQAPTREPAQRR